MWAYVNSIRDKAGHRHPVPSAGDKLRKKGRPVTGRADVVVVGGGHNGLVAAAYLARAGLEVVVCERRGVTGGAAVSEHPFGPDFTVTSLSYVVSLLPPDLVRDLRLEQHGYHVYPQGPYFAPRTRRSRSCGCWRRPTCPTGSWPTSAAGAAAAAR